MKKNMLFLFSIFLFLVGCASDEEIKSNKNATKKPISEQTQSEKETINELKDVIVFNDEIKELLNKSDGEMNEHLKFIVPYVEKTLMSVVSYDDKIKVKETHESYLLMQDENIKLIEKVKIKDLTVEVKKELKTIKGLAKQYINEKKELSSLYNNLISSNDENYKMAIENKTSQHHAMLKVITNRMEKLEIKIKEKSK